MSAAISGHRRGRWIAMAVVAVMPLAACGGGDDAADNDAAGDATADATADPGGGGGDAGGSQGSGGGTLVLGDETIRFDSARCFLQEQDAAAGGGKILFVAQAYGTTAAGDELVIDVSRYDEDSQFAGDDINVDIGDPFSDDAVSFRAATEIGTVTVDGSNVSADGLTFRNFDLGLEEPGSFEINC